MQDAQLISQAGLVESLASDGLVSVSTGAGQPQKNMELAKFADSLGSSVPLQQNAEQVGITGLYARTSDGKMVELTKESVASVMAGLVVSFPKYGALDDVNLDDIKTVGTYTVGDGCTNKPANETWNHSMLQVVVGRNDWVTQIYYSGAYGKIYIRHFKYNDTSTGEWSSWSTINFGYNTLAELSSGVSGQLGFIIYSNVLNAGDSVTLNKGYGMLIIDNITNGRSAIYGISNGNFDLLSSKDETGLTISYVSEHVISLTNMNNALVTLQVRII